MGDFPFEIFVVKGPIWLEEDTVVGVGQPAFYFWLCCAILGNIHNLSEPKSVKSTEDNEEN